MQLIHLFSGIGAPEKALKNLNIEFKNVAHCEINEKVDKVYNLLGNNSLNLGDITKVQETDLYRGMCDLLVYGSPCQSFSLVGHQKGAEKGSGTASSLIWEVEKFIKIIRPSYLLMENVEALVSKKFKPFFNKWLEVLNSYGYNSYWKVLNSEDFGIPQFRKRVFVVSIRKDLLRDYNFPNGYELKISLEDILETKVNPEYFQLEHLKYVQKFRSDNPIHEIQDKTYLGTFQFSKSDNFMRGKNRLSIGKKVSDTLQTTQKEAIVYKDFSLRKLTPLECFRLMGFSDSDYLLVKDKVKESHLYYMLGNSIVVSVLEAIFKNLLI